MTVSGRIYCDHNASAPLRPAAREAMLRALDLSGNPSSMHGEGRAARAVIEAARRQVAAAVGGRPQDVIFTSGATEGLNALLRPDVQPASGADGITRLILGATEHAAALQGHGFSADACETIRVNAEGLVDLSWLSERLAGLRGAAQFAPAMVAVQAANSETGVQQPLDAIARAVGAVGAPLIVDAVQMIGRAPFDLAASNAAAIVLSAHKFGGPKGVGAIVLNGDSLQFGRALIAGGGQELRRRAGTENVAGIAGMGAAIRAAVDDLPAESQRLSALRDRLEQAMARSAPEAVIFGKAAPRLPNTTLVAVPGLKAETLLMAFDMAGVALSSGSACSSGKVGRSHVLAAMGVAPDLAEGALRFSLGWTTTEADIERLISIFGSVITTLSLRKNRRAA